MECYREHHWNQAPDDRRPELGPDRIKLVQGGVHGLANWFDSVGARPHEVRLNSQPANALTQAGCGNSIMITHWPLQFGHGSVKF